VLGCEQGTGLRLGVKLLLGDELRREAPRAVQALREAGVSRIVMVTGDRVDAAETIGAALDLDAVLANRVPSDKVEAVATEQRGGALPFRRSRSVRQADQPGRVQLIANSKQRAGTGCTSMWVGTCSSYGKTSCSGSPLD
jgi:magnesium-transporting ATPase (P-type)